MYKNAHNAHWIGALEVFRNHALQIDIYLRTYLYIYSNAAKRLKT